MPERHGPKGNVGIARNQRLSARRTAAGDDPVVAAGATTVAARAACFDPVPTGGILTGKQDALVILLTLQKGAVERSFPKRAAGPVPGSQ